MDAYPFKMLNHLIECRNDQSPWKFSIFTYHQYLRNIMRFFHYIFNLLRSDVFAPGSLEYLLLAVGNFQENLVELADVAGVQPSFRINSLSCQFRLVIVAHHHIRTAIENLAIFGNFHDPPGYDRPDRTDFVTAIRRVIYGNNRRSFCRTVALVHWHPRSAENPGQTRLQSRRTGDDRSDLASQSSPPS